MAFGTGRVGIAPFEGDLHLLVTADAIAVIGCFQIRPIGGAAGQRSSVQRWLLAIGSAITMTRTTRWWTGVRWAVVMASGAKRIDGAVKTAGQPALTADLKQRFYDFAMLYHRRAVKLAQLAELYGFGESRTDRR